MKVIILTTNHYLAASTSVKAFLQNTLRKKYDIEVVGIVATKMFSLDKRLWKRMLRFLKRSGFEFFIKSVLADIWQRASILYAKYFIPDYKRQHFEIQELAQKYKIPFLYVSDIHCPKSLNFIKKKNPDYLVSCLLMQVAKKSLLKIPTEGSINFHPALFQDHRGTFASFWTLLRNRRTSGTTVHFMTEKLDDGKVILQRRFRIHPSDTIHCINQKSARLGGNLLVKALVKLKKKKVRPIWVRKVGRLFTMPTRSQANLFIKKGKRIIKWKDFFQI